MMMKRNVLFSNNHDIHQLFIFITTAERLKVHYMTPKKMLQRPGVQNPIRFLGLTMLKKSAVAITIFKGLTKMWEMWEMWDFFKNVGHILQNVGNVGNVGPLGTLQVKSVQSLL